VRHQDALVVVLEHDGIRDPDGRLHSAEELLDFLTVEVRVLLFVHSNNLLGAGDDSRLRRRGTLDGHQRLDGRLDLLKHRAEPRSAHVVADRCHEAAVRADRADVLGDVAGPSQGVPSLPDTNHRNWRFRRDTVDVAMQVDVEHGVANHRHPALRGGVEQRGDSFARNELGHGR